MEEKFKLKGKQVSRHLVHADGQWRTKVLFNGHTNSYIETEGGEFSIEVEGKGWLPPWGNGTTSKLQVRREFIEYNLLPEYEDHTEKWEDDLVNGIAGHFHHSHYSTVDYKILDETPSGLAFYSRVMKWAKKHVLWLTDSKIIGGDPGKGELFGWIHRDEKKGTNTIHFRTPKTGGRGSKVGIWLKCKVLLSSKQITSTSPTGVLDFPTRYNSRQRFYFTVLEPK